MALLEIKDLHVEIEGKKILRGINLSLNEGEIHAIMGPNGHGKSTLLAAIMGHPKYTVTQGSITFNGKDVLSMEVNERAQAGLFLGMQYPMEISGVSNSDFMKAALNTRRAEPIPLFTFIRKLEGAIKDLEMKSNLAHRYVNEGFSGGEKKRNEILQMILLEPKLAMLDEIDSGLDVDALKIVAKAINEQAQKAKTTLMLVSHYERFYQLVQPTHAHIIVNGQVVFEGGRELVTKIDEEGYNWLQEQLGFEIKDEEAEINTTTVGSLGTCAVKDWGDASV